MEEINLYDLLRHYAKYWILKVLISLVGLGGGEIYNQYIQKPSYKANATLLLVTNDQVVTTYDTTLIDNYMALLKSRSILEPVIHNLKLSESYQDLSSSLTTSNPANTEIIQLFITNKNAQPSADEVNSAVSSFTKEVSNIYGMNNVKVIDNANTPSTPYNIHKPLQLALFTAVGFLLSIIAVFFVYDFRLNQKKTKLNKNKNEILNNKALTTAFKHAYKWPVTSTKTLYRYITTSMKQFNESFTPKQELSKKTKAKTSSKTKKPAKKK